MTSVVVNEGHKVFGSTERFGTDLSAHITVHEFERVSCFPFRFTFEWQSVTLPSGTWFTEIRHLLAVEVQAMNHLMFN